MKLSQESRPEELVVEVSSMCNMNCLYCFRRAARDLEPRYMNLDLFKILIVEASSIGIKKIVFSGWGEPLLHPYIDYMIRLCRDLGLSVALNTNGVLLYKSINLVLENVDELYISLDVESLKTHTSTCNTRVFNSIVTSLEEILRAKQLSGSLKPRVIALYTVTKSNISDIELFLELSRNLGVNEIVFSFSIPFSTNSINCLDSLACVDEFYVKIREAVGKLREFGLNLTIPLRPYSPSVKCPFANSRALFIRSDGFITPCIYYAYSWKTVIFGVERYLKSVILGRISRDKLIDVWRNKYAKILYRLNLRKSIPSCLTCTLVEYCAKTRDNSVDCLGGEPNCGHCPFYHGLTFCPL